MHERGEPIAALWASEETIYGRFGYGLASWAASFSVPHEWDAFAAPLEPAATPRFVTPEEARELFPPDLRGRPPERPGMIVADARRGGRTAHLPTPTEREADAPSRFVALERRRRAAGYAIYRHHFGFEGGLAGARLVVREALGATPAATAAIWRFLLDVDWMAVVEVPSLRPTTRSSCSSRCRAGRSTGWATASGCGSSTCRRALAGRAYGQGGPLVLEVRDAICEWNDGRWKLDGGACERTEDEPDLALDVSVLGSAYLGAVSFTQLRDAGAGRGAAGGSDAGADALFAWRPLPWCPEIFLRGRHFRS